MGHYFWKVKIEKKMEDPALKDLNIDSLQGRRESLCLKVAKKCLKVDKLRKMFPKKALKKLEFYRVNRTLTSHYLDSADAETVEC